MLASTSYCRVTCPLVENQQTQVEEQEHHEDYLWDKFADDINLSPKEHVVPQANHDSEQHVDNSDNN